ncbi:MAG: DNA-binding response regulator [Acidobacteria bacterium]|nr:MAG: DNA-binding response regulator [Acidobacteriota bacterium]
MRILIVEDEEHIADGIKFNLEAEGFEALVVDTGEVALEEIGSTKFDAVILDVMLPGIDGFEVAKQLRADQNFVPVLMLTARSRPEDVLKGFEAGADDYLPKPFELEIFLARLNGLLRRNEWARSVPKAKDGRETINGRIFDLANLQLHTSDGVQNLTLMEAKLLAYLIEHEGQAVSRKTILEDVWGLQEDTDTRAIDNFIVRLRKILEDEPNDPKFLKTVRGIGYRLDRK